MVRIQEWIYKLEVGEGTRVIRLGLAILALLAARAFRSSTRELLRTRWFWLSLLLVVLYALGDEFHQSFVPSRTASIYDSMIDTLGGLTALAFLTIRKYRTHRQDLHD